MNVFTEVIYDNVKIINYFICIVRIWSNEALSDLKTNLEKSESS